MCKKNIPVKTIYYKDELNDDFASTQDMAKKQIDEKYNYFKVDKFFLKALSKTLYYILAKPVLWLLNKIIFDLKFVNKKVFRQRGKKGCFIYANHTNYLPDATVGSLVHWGQNQVVCGSEPVTIPVIGPLVAGVGALPLGNTISAKKNFMKFMKSRLDKNDSISIYPEAHIWPYFTGVRNFIPGSMAYPCEYNVPSFSITMCYQKKKFSKSPKMIAICDGPFYPDLELPKKERINKLRDEIYITMVENTKKYSTYEYYKYIKQDEDKIEEEKVEAVI